MLTLRLQVARPANTARIIGSFIIQKQVAGAWVTTASGNFTSDFSIAAQPYSYSTTLGTAVPPPAGDVYQAVLSYSLQPVGAQPGLIAVVNAPQILSKK